ncbi:MAG: AsnC family protein [Alphaproteobacteria bacterium]|nr:AsnC family protein [Alphaproteobacteria bacterium]
MEATRATRAVRWTAPLDAFLRRLRAEGASWAEIAGALAVSPDVARERGRRIGAVRPPPQARAPREEMARGPLPPGHPRSWGLLVAGTLLDGTKWPGWD